MKISSGDNRVSCCLCSTQDKIVAVNHNNLAGLVCGIVFVCENCLGRFKEQGFLVDIKPGKEE